MENYEIMENYHKIILLASTDEKKEELLGSNIVERLLEQKLKLTASLTNSGLQAMSTWVAPPCHTFCKILVILTKIV